MKETTARTRANAKYNKKAYDTMSVRVKKGGNAYIVSLATKAGKSKAQFIKDLVLAEAEKYGSEERKKAREALLTDTAISGGE